VLSAAAPDGRWSWPSSKQIIRGLKNLAANTVAFVAGASNAVASNMAGGFPGTRGNPNDFGEYAGAAAAGQTAGDVISVVGGATAAIGGGVAIVAEAVTGAGAVAIPATGAVAAEGLLTAGTGLRSLMADGGENNQGSGEGRGKNNRKPDSEAKGDHSVFNEKGKTTYKQNEKNPSGFDEVKRTDIEGRPHTNKDGTKVPTPHVHTKGEKDVRPAVKGKDY